MDERPLGIRELVAACALAFVATGAAAAAPPTLVAPGHRPEVAPPAARSIHHGGRTWGRGTVSRG